MEVIISARKLESYKRAEIVGQALREYIASGPRYTQDQMNNMLGALNDWMNVTTKIKYDKPKRRGRAWKPL